jgi:class 3 adenylate cyclase
VLSYFGWPQAHEEDAERAVRAGLKLAAAVATLKTTAGERLAARVGIATGLVVVGEIMGADRVADPSASQKRGRKTACGAALANTRSALINRDPLSFRKS